ncbi:MAP kinase kinase kinase activity protein [Phytophthora ramorum]
MFLHKLLDPEDERRRRVRRARIVRRNRIKREVAQGQPVRTRRVPKAGDFALSLDSEDGFDEYGESKTPFRPTFGGNSDDSTREGQAVNPIRAAPQQSPSPTKSLLSATRTGSKSSASQSPAPNAAAPSSDASSPGNVQPKAISTHIRAKWREVFQQVVFQRHEEILAKDPNRKWRQERFGLLLFAKGEYTRASDHLNKAVSLGATSSLCWRRLAESYYHMWEDGGEWEVLWACRAAYEQALNHVEVASSPLALFAYARVLELLGSYTGALTICASILQTFPKFEQLRDVKLRFVLLQRHQLFSSSPTDPTADFAKLAILTKCIGYTQELLLDKAITEGPRHINVLYLHTRLNEMLADVSTASTSQTSGHPQKSKLVHVSVDVLFQELYKLAMQNSEVAPPPGVKWKSWKARSETYTAFAEYFRALGESVLASDALSRSLELLEALPPESDSSKKLTNLWRGITEDQRRRRIAVYVVLARNYYQCNQMEKATRSMEAVFDLDPLHAEARASLVEWFPAKWQYRLELEDASQVQIARVLRGIWGRKVALARRREAQRSVEQQYRENPYHLGCRRRILRLLRGKYASLFAAQDLAARSLQRGARRYLYYARMRWKVEGQREKILRELISKHQTRKYRYNRQVRTQLAALLPNEYETCFFREDCSALRIQRCFRGKRTRSEFRRLRDARRQLLRHRNDAAEIIQRFSRRYCSSKATSAPPVDELLFRAQRKLARAKERLALMLQRLYRRWKGAEPQTHSSLFHAFQAEAIEQRQILLEQTSALKIQRLWRRYTAGIALGGRVSSQAQILLVEQFFTAQRRQTFLEVDLDHAARIIQAVYRGKLMRRFLRMLRGRVIAPPCASPIATLITKCEANHQKGVETMAELYSIDNLAEKRALFDHPVLVLRGPRAAPRPTSPSTDESFSLQHVVSAIQYSAVLKTLICASGDFKGERISTILQALQTRRTLRVLALGGISTVVSNISTNQEPDACTAKNQSIQLESTEWSVGATDERDTDTSPSSPLSRRLLSLPSPPSSPSPHQKRQLSAMQILSKALCTSNFLLEELYLERNTLLERPQEGEILASIMADYFFARYGRLHTLVVAHMRFSDANGALLGAALATNTVLQKMDLHGNLLSDGAAIAIANDGLAHNKSLRYLNLAENTIGSAGGKALFRCLGSHNRTLETLILRNNHLMSDVMPSLIEAWLVNAVIESVDLAGNLIDDRYLAEIQAAAAERREVTPSKDNQELRLLIARKRFGIRDTRSPISRRGIGIFATPLSSPVKGGSRKKKTKNAPLSPKKWLSVNAPKIISPIAYPTTTNRQANEVYPSTKASVENVYAPPRPRKLLKATHSSPARLVSPSKLPALPVPVGKKRQAW